MVYLALALKALTRLLKGFIIIPNDQPIPCTITNDKLPIGVGVFNQVGESSPSTDLVSLRLQTRSPSNALSQIYSL